MGEDEAYAKPAGSLVRDDGFEVVTVRTSPCSQMTVARAHGRFDLDRG